MKSANANMHKEIRYPLVSVIMSTYNDQSFVEAAINSILHQSYANLELIIIDDASTDNTVAILKGFEDSRISLHINKTNKKLAHNMNYAISIAKGEYIVRMDADDIAAPERISSQVEYMEVHKEVDMCGTYAKAFGSDNYRMYYPQNQDDIKIQLLFTNAFCHPTVMFRRSSIDEIYDEAFPAGQDYELWSRIVWKKQVRNIPEFLLNYRVHQGQTKHKNGIQQKAGAVQARTNMIKKLLPDINEDDLYVFQMMTSGAKTNKELMDIERVLNTIVKVNENKKIFNENALKDRCGKEFFLCWYLSLGTTDANIATIKRSVFWDSFCQQGITRKLKAYLKLLYLNLRRKHSNTNNSAM